MPEHIPSPAHIAHSRVRIGPQKGTVIGRLSATLRVKDSLIQGHPGAVDERYRCLHPAQIAVGMIQVIAVHEKCLLRLLFLLFLEKTLYCCKSQQQMTLAEQKDTNV